MTVSRRSFFGILAAAPIGVPVALASRSNPTINAKGAALSEAEIRQIVASSSKETLDRVRRMLPELKARGALRL